MEKINIGCAAGTKWLHGQSVAAGLAEMMEEQAGEQRLADAGVGAGDEDNSGLHFPEGLTADGTDGTDKRGRGNGL